MAWDYSSPSEPSYPEMTAAMGMSEHCDHEKSSASQDCLNHCATLVALPVNPVQPSILLSQSVEFDQLENSLSSRLSDHWRPPSYIS